jgi:PhzF family phenazine biosynthesis protein
MPTFRYLELDVFPATSGGGNPLGVVVDARGWEDEAMQRFAAWTNLVETTFLLPAENDASNYHLRIFTPAKEIPFAGHPSIGSAHAALDTGFAKAHDGKLIQQCGAGLLPVRVEGDGETRELFVQAPAAKNVTHLAASRHTLSAALGDHYNRKLSPGLIEGGRRWWVAEFADEESVRSWQPDHETIGALAKVDNCLGLCVFARCGGADYQLVVRAFPAGVGIVEDPASGAANGLIATWIAMREPDGPLARGYRVSQGREMGHDASITIRIDADRTVWVGGRTQTIADRTLTWP